MYEDWKYEYSNKIASHLDKHLKMSEVCIIDM